VAPLWDWDLAGSMEKVPVGRKSQGSRLKSQQNLPNHTFFLLGQFQESHQGVSRPHHTLRPQS
jgi:hypothetical protein